MCSANVKYADKLFVQATARAAIIADWRMRQTMASCSSRVKAFFESYPLTIDFAGLELTCKFLHRQRNVTLTLRIMSVSASKPSKLGGMVAFTSRDRTKARADLYPQPSSSGKNQAISSACTSKSESCCFGQNVRNRQDCSNKPS